MKKIVLSGTTTSGELTIGNYIGAINQWKEMIEDYDCYFMVANLHSITVYQDPNELISRTEKFFALYIALGLDPSKCTIFIQSQVPEHSQLQWILNCLVPIGYLNRMTQFKDKSQNSKNILAGLLNYPVLMAADILLYKADFVPVGEDQKQHLELCRDIVGFFENNYGQLWKMPNPLIPKEGARIMSLTDPLKKMSKSDIDKNSFISLLDEPKVVEKKIKKAVTDLGTKVAYNLENKGIANLMTLYHVLSGLSYHAIEKEFEGKLYGHFKVQLAEIINEKLMPVREEYFRIMKDKTYLNTLMNKGAEKASEKAQTTLKEVFDKVGLKFQGR
jgi:tryptophanyl-tRNA synthetase